MKVETISFTDIQTDLCEELLNLEYDYDKDREIRGQIFSQYREQRCLSDELFSNWLAQTNDNLIKDVDNFIRHSLGIDGKKFFFEESHSHLIHPATVILGLQATDHGPTLDMIEQHVEKEHHQIKTLRVSSGLSKKSQVLEIYNQKYKSPNLLVIIEQTEIMDKNLLESLVSGLYERLYNEVSERIMILFCMSGSWKSINHLFPISIMNRMKKTTTIVKETSIVFHDIQSKLLKNDELIFKLNPDLMKLIEDEFMERDASIINIKYLYQYALFVHHNNDVSLLTLPQKDLSNLLKSQPELFLDLKKLTSLSAQKETISRMKPTSFAQYCVDQIKRIQNYHRFISEQLSYFLILLRDEARESFPDNLYDIYEALFKFEDLGHSPDFVDAISKLNKYSIDGLKRRLNKIRECRIDPLPYEMSDDKDVYYILMDFSEKLENNDDGNLKSLTHILIDRLLKHSQILKRPQDPLFESIYHSQVRQVKTQAQPTTAYRAMIEYNDNSTNFGSLYSIINTSPEEINMNILFGDFMDAFELSTKKRKAAPGSNVSPSKARKSGRGKTKLLAEPFEEGEGLVKAIFVDLVDCMEFQGLVKLDKRQSRQDILKRVVWL